MRYGRHGYPHFLSTTWQLMCLSQWATKRFNIAMEYSVNTRPLLQESDSEGDDETVNINHVEGVSDDHVVATKDVRPLIKVREPSDRYNLAYIIFYLLGMTTLLPWNFFITADEYWMYKLRDVSRNITTGPRTELQASFTSYLSVASNVPNTLFLILNTLFSHKISLSIRMIGSLSFIVLLFIFTTVLVEIDTDSWQELFFIITLVTVVLLNIGSAVMQGGLFGIVGKFSSRYITAVVGGQALGGIFAAVAEIVSLYLGVSPTKSAFVYFMVANAMLILTLAAYVILSRTVFFRFHMLDKIQVSTMQYHPSVIQAEENPVCHRELSYKDILKKIWVYGFTVWMVFFITLAMYPAITVLVVSMGSHKSAWNDIYFVPVVGYLVFSMCDYLGRLLSGWIQWPIYQGWLQALLSILRIVFIPLILFCNAQPRHNIPVLLDSDGAYIAVIILFGITNGYLANITFISVPRIVDSGEQEIASSMMAAFLGAGLACGSAVSLAMVKFL